jgi:hypothetical protein
MLREILGGNFRAETGLRESTGRYRKRGGKPKRGKSETHEASGREASL